MNIKYIRKLGKGICSEVWLTVHNKNIYATKIFDSCDGDIVPFYNEIRCQRLAASHGLAPKIHFVNTLHLIGFEKCYMFMDPLLSPFKTDYQLLYDLENRDKKFSYEYNNIIQYKQTLQTEIETLGIRIPDLQTMLHVEDGEVKKGYVIDFGNAEILLHTPKT